jgi:hypothetical protein
VPLVRLSLDFFGGKKRPVEALSLRSSYIYSFFSAVLFVNALAHFTHGISGEPFVGPYRFLVGSGLWNNLLNVVWGFVNIVLGYGLFVRAQPFSTTVKKRSFFAGVLAMGVFLCIVFTR